MNILVLDDDKMVETLIEKALAPEGHVITCVKTIAGAIKKIKSDPPDLFLLDLHLEMETGYDFLAERARDKDLQAVPVFIISASNQELDIVTTAIRGASNYLLKPLNKKVLVEKIQKLAC